MAKPSATELRRQNQEDVSLRGATFPDKLDADALANRIKQYAAGVDLSERHVYDLCTSIHSGLGESATGDQIRKYLEPNFEANKEALDSLVRAVERTGEFCALVKMVCDQNLVVDSLDARERLHLVQQLQQALRPNELPQEVFDAARPVFRRIMEQLSKPDALGEIACDLLKPGAKVNLNGGLKTIVAVEESADSDRLRISMRQGRQADVYVSLVAKGTLANVPGSDVSEANKTSLAASIGVTLHKAGVWFGLKEMERLLDEERHSGDNRYTPAFQRCFEAACLDQGEKRVPAVSLFVDTAVGAAVAGMLTPKEERLIERTLIHVKDQMHTDLVVMGATNQLSQSNSNYRRWTHPALAESLPGYFTKDKGVSLRPVSALVDNHIRLKLYCDGVGVLGSSAARGPLPTRSDFEFGRFTSSKSDPLSTDISTLKQMGKSGSGATRVEVVRQAEKLVKPYVERLQGWLTAELGPEWQKKIVVTPIPGTTGMASDCLGKAVAIALKVPYEDLICREPGPSLKGRPGIKSRLEGIAGRMSLYDNKLGTIPNLLVVDDVLDLGVSMKIAENVLGPLLAPGGKILTCVAGKK